MPHGNSSLPCLCITNGVYFYSIVRFVNCVKPKSIIKYRNLHDQHHRLGGIAWRDTEARGRGDDGGGGASSLAVLGRQACSDF